MADPAIITLNEWEWVKVATNVVTGSIHRLNTVVYYYQTFRLTGEVAPTAPTLGTIPEEAVRIFDKSNQVLISSNDFIDVYIMCANSDEDSDDDVGKIRVDL
jgi:hypothetical protein